MSLSSSLSSSATSGLTSNAPITIGGLSSGLDTSTIIQSLTTAEGQAQQVEQNKENTLNTQLTAWQTFNSQLMAFQSVVSGLSSPAAFNDATISVGTSTVASATAQPGAEVGSHTLTVNQLAQAQKVLSGSFTDSNTPLQVSGSFLLNGKSVTVAASDTLSDVATKINASGAGVTASVLNVGTGNTILSLTSGSTGTVNALSATDSGGGTALEQLGFLPASGATTLRQSLTRSGGGSGAGSLAFANASQTVGTLLGGTSGAAPSGNVTIAGTTVNLNLNTMSLNDVANAINSAGISGVTASIVAIPDANGDITSTSKQQLQIVSNGSNLTASAFSDPSGVLAALGVTQTGFSNQVTSAGDANFSLDGVSYTRSSNAVNDVIPGVSVTLLTAGTTAAPATTTLDLTTDPTNIVSEVNNFVQAYNGINDAIQAQFNFTPPAAGSTGQQASSPALFGDSTLSSIQQQLANTLGVTSGSTSLSSIGITVGSTGDLTLNSNTLTTALQNDPQAISNLFGLSGSASNASVSFVSASGKTQATATGGYAVNITQAATQASVTGAAPAAPTLATAETLSFSGSLFSSSTPSITLSAGNTLQQSIAQINNDSLVNQSVIATASSDGKLVITSKGYGSKQDFTVTSNQSGGTGFTPAAANGVGQDVQGTIDGEPATGLGQSLVGNVGNAHTEALSLLVTATAPGSYGAVTVTHGVADQINALVNSFTDPNTGSIVGAENSINSQITDVQTQITQMQAQLNAYSENLQMEFANMEAQLSKLQSQSAAFTASVNGANGTSSASSTASKL